MKYKLVIADREEHVIKQYNNVELISFDGDMAKMRFDCDPEFSADPEHPDYILFSVFRDRAVNVYEYEWTHFFDEELFLPCYNCDGFATYKVLELKKMGA